MPNVITITRPVTFQSFALFRWPATNDTVPLVLKTPIAVAKFYLKGDAYDVSGITVIPRGHIELAFEDPHPNFLTSLKANGAGKRHAGDIIYQAYKSAFDQLQALLPSAGGIRIHLALGGMSKSEFFDRHFIERVMWRHNEGPFEEFRVAYPKPKGRHPMYKADNLVTPARWARMQRAATAGELPPEEVLELYRIRSKAGWRDLRIATVEASIISEALLRAFARQVLTKLGFSTTRLKGLSRELTFSTLLNIVLPLALTKTEARRFKQQIQAVDKLRSIRNEVVHENIPIDAIDEEAVNKGIDGAIKLAGFLKLKLS